VYNIVDKVIFNFFGKTHIKGLIMGFDILEYDGNMHLERIGWLKL
jgi:hypothetical protein